MIIEFHIKLHVKPAIDSHNDAFMVLLLRDLVIKEGRKIQYFPFTHLAPNGSGLLLIRATQGTLILLPSQREGIGTGQDELDPLQSKGRLVLGRDFSGRTDVSEGVLLVFLYLRDRRKLCDRACE